MSPLADRSVASPASRCSRTRPATSRSASNSSRRRPRRWRQTLWESVKTLEPLAPRFVSVTYGAGGSTRERTHATVARIARETALHAAAHLTCVEASRGEIDDDRPRLLGRRHPPHRRPARRSARAGQAVRAAPGRLCQCRRAGRRPEEGRAVRDFGRRLSRMPSRIRPTPAADLDNLKRKIDAGADRAITQFFFSPDCFFRFRDDVAAAGIDAEIMPGILPVSNVAQTRKFAAMCGAAIPAWLDRLFEGLDDLPAARQLVAATVAAELCAPALCRRRPRSSISTRSTAPSSATPSAICSACGRRKTDQ